MIESAKEFVRLRNSDQPEEYHRATWEEAPVEVWMEVIEHHPDMVRWVAHNKSIPKELIRLLAQHPDSDVRFFIAAKRKTPQDVLQKLTRDLCDSIRMQVAVNAKSSRETLQILINDPCDQIRERVHKRLGE
ncbi:HEAT repeat domain-containing protein [Deinococcus cellulosilyticus]|uniref:Leucine rich repeat variant n=1 Tax=Deinococcus cellulosilyticus (strain DSM 18568 / NBRC 106333 / KACC 11606 / 5516J-15) TaxID=1223518 RepID=A0A511N6U8_DEIC1|nr:HEAT repeat domain-containing protein [Deinococcus cellulosilyticus]GEM48141.1 hypothetical protein DC3_37760 [Deinococcus cellulosilyticus NBRC 106333 = KACC 11606]